MKEGGDTTGHTAINLFSDPRLHQLHTRSFLRPHVRSYCRVLNAVLCFAASVYGPLLAELSLSRSAGARASYVRTASYTSRPFDVRCLRLVFYLFSGRPLVLSWSRLQDCHCAILYPAIHGKTESPSHHEVLFRASCSGCISQRCGWSVLYSPCGRLGLISYSSQCCSTSRSFARNICCCCPGGRDAAVRTSPAR